MADPVNLSDPQSAALALLGQAFQRSQQQQPLFQAANQGMFQMLPSFATQGIDPSAITGTPMPTTGGGGGMNPLLSALMGAGAGAAASQIPFDKIAQAIKALFGHGPSIQGNKPYPGGTGLPSFGPDPTQFSGWDPRVSDPNGTPYLPSDPGVWYGTDGSGAYPTDPSGGTGVGPGMQNFYSDYGGDY